MASRSVPPLLKEIAQHRADLIAWNVDHFSIAVKLAAAAIRTKLIDLLGDLSPENVIKASALVNLQRELQRQMNASGYEAAVQTFVGSYSDTDALAIEVLKALNIKPVTLAPLDTRVLSKIKAIDFGYLSDLGPSSVQAVTSGVVRSALLGTPRSAIISVISGTLEEQFQHRAQTYSDTALTSFDALSSMTVWKEAGLDKYTYQGPADIKNRPLCEHLVGKTFTVAQIGKLDTLAAKYSKHPLLPVIVFRGGWNCRHQWVPAVSGSR